MSLATTAPYNFSLDYDAAVDNATDTDDSYAESSFEQFANALNIYYTPVLVFLGCTGNIMSIIVFYKSKLRLQSTSQYLSALALSDTLFLCQLVPPWLKTMEASPLFSQHGFCQVFVYLSYVTCNHSSWLVVAFTVERFVAVVHPLRRTAVCSVKRARHVILSLAALALLINVPVLRFAVIHSSSERAPDCNIDGELMEHAARFNIFDTMLSFTLPLAIIVVLNSWIMVRVYRVGRSRAQLTRSAATTGARRALHARTGAARLPRRTSQHRVTSMLLTVSSVFVLFNLPAYTMRIFAYANNMGEHEYSGKMAATQQICLLLFNTNFGINFYLYCLSGQNFRRALGQTFPWLRRRKLSVAVRRDTFQRPARASSNSNSYATTNNTEATNYGVSGSAGNAPLVAAVSLRRARTSERSYIERWSFNNTRPGRAENYPLQIFGAISNGNEAQQPTRWTDGAACNALYRPGELHPI